MPRRYSGVRGKPDGSAKFRLGHAAVERKKGKKVKTILLIF
jgi:hypothetical protein